MCLFGPWVSSKVKQVTRFPRFSSKKSRHCLVDIPGFCLSLANCPRCTCLRMKAKGPRRLEACGWRVLLVPDSVSPPLSCFRSLSAIISITTAAATTSTATVTLFKYAKRAFIPLYPRKSYRISVPFFLLPFLFSLPLNVIPIPRLSSR